MLHFTENAPVAIDFPPTAPESYNPSGGTGNGNGSGGNGNDGNGSDDNGNGGNGSDDNNEYGGGTVIISPTISGSSGAGGNSSSNSGNGGSSNNTSSNNNITYSISVVRFNELSPGNTVVSTAAFSQSNFSFVHILSFFFFFF
jgi:hypothetical protein